MIYDLKPVRGVPQALIDDELDKVNAQRLRCSCTAQPVPTGVEQRIAELEALDAARRAIFHARRRA